MHEKICDDRRVYDDMVIWKYNKWTTLGLGFRGGDAIQYSLLKSVNRGIFEATRRQFWVMSKVND